MTVLANYIKTVQMAFFPLAPLLGSSLLYGSTGLINQILDLSQAVGLRERGISSPTHRTTQTQKNADTH
jgi:hypothetical protein